MRAVIVPVFDDSDLSALNNCLRYLATQPVELLMVIHNPDVGVVNADLTQEFDKKLAELKVRQSELVLVEDFAGAQRAKEKIEAVRVDRDIAIREAWKSVAEEQRAVMYKKAFGEIGTEPICLRECYTHEQVFTMLNQLLPQWPVDIKHGEYSLIWPRSIPTIAASVPRPVVLTTPVARPLGRVAVDREDREQQLRKMHHVAALQIAKRAGIEVKGRKVNDIIVDVLDKEFPRELAAV